MLTPGVFYSVTAAVFYFPRKKLRLCIKTVQSSCHEPFSRQSAQHASLAQPNLHPRLVKELRALSHGLPSYLGRLPSLGSRPAQHNSVLRLAPYVATPTKTHMAVFIRDSGGASPSRLASDELGLMASAPLPNVDSNAGVHI